MSADTLYLIPDVDRIGAARWAARELLLGRIAGAGPRGWTTRIDGKGGIVSKAAHAPLERRRPR